MAEDAIGYVGTERNPTLIADFTRAAAALAAGASFNFTASKLETDEVAEIEYLEIFSPLLGVGIEDLRSVIPVIDGHALEEYVHLNGRYDYNMAPPRLHQMAGPSPLQSQSHVFSFGTPGVEDPLLNTTLKVKDTLSVRLVAGTAATTQQIRVRAWGYLYKGEDTIKSLYGDSVYGASADMYDYNRGKHLAVEKAEVPITRDNWDMLVGGTRQNSPQVMPFVRWGYNLLATTANELYDFDYDSGRVANSYENMYFDFDENDALFVSGIGVRNPSTLRYLGLKIGDREYPRGGGDETMFRVDFNNNPMHFGQGTPMFPAAFPIFMPIPELPLKYLIHNEKGRLVVQDDGTAVALNTIIAAIKGVKVDL
jgi:hypothetical protein